jgi:hypothetical protein
MGNSLVNLSSGPDLGRSVTDDSARTDGYNVGAMSAMRDAAGRAVFALASGSCRELRRFRRDQSGVYLIIAGLMMPLLVGLVGLGTDATLWYNKHRAMQDAADAGAVSAATAFSNGVGKSLVTSQANAVASSYGFINGTNNVTVTVNQPPLSGTHTNLRHGQAPLRSLWRSRKPGCSRPCLVRDKLPSPRAPSRQPLPEQAACLRSITQRRAPPPM